MGTFFYLLPNVVGFFSVDVFMDFGCRFCRGMRIPDFLFLVPTFFLIFSRNLFRPDLPVFPF